MTDKEIGLKVLKSFYEWSRYYNGSVFKVSFDQFLKSIQPNQAKLDIALDGIGFGVRSAEVSDSKINAAMTKMAIASRGKIPSNPQDFFKYLSNEAVKVNWIDATVYVAKESAKDIVSGVQAVGDSLITTGKIVNFLLPAIGLFFVFSYLNKSTNGDLANFAKSFKK